MEPSAPPPSPMGREANIDVAEPGPSRTRRRALRHLWAAQSLSQLGDHLLGVALALYVLDASGSVVLSTASLLVNLLPGVALGAIAGAVVDRCDRRRLLVTVSAARAVLVLPLLLVTTGVVPLEAVLLISLAKSTVAQLAGPAVGASVPTIVAKHELPRANARLAGTGVVLQLTAPALGAVLYAAHGLTVAVLCNAVSYLLAAATWLGLPPAATRPAVSHRVWRSSAEGFRLVRQDRVLSRLLVALGVGLTGFAMQAALLVPFVRLELQGSAASVGLISSVQAGGALAAAVVFTRLNRRLGNLGAAALGMYGLPVATAALVLSREVPHVYPGVVTAGFLLALLTSGAQVYLQQNVPGPFLGRVLGIISSTIAISSVAGTALALVLSVWLDLRIVLLVAALIEVLGVMVYVAPTVRRRRTRIADAPSSARERCAVGSSQRT